MLCSAHISTGMSTVGPFQLCENQNILSHWKVWFQQRDEEINTQAKARVLRGGQAPAHEL